MTPDASIYNEDCISGMTLRLRPESVDLCVTSIPFGSLFMYSGLSEDIGNNKDFSESEVPNPFGPAMADIWEYARQLLPLGDPRPEDKRMDLVSCSFGLHMRFFLWALYRVMKPGTNVCIHIQQLLRYKNAHGYMGRRDFRGAVIDIFTAGGFEWKGECVIPKNPQIMAQRNSLHSLMFITGKRNATELAPAPNDFILIFQKTGEKVPRVSALYDIDNPGGWVTTEEWINWACGVWPDIRETDVLEGWQAGREKDDEKHVCPLQLEVIRRLIRLYSNPGELILDPFMGIGSTAWIALGGETQAHQTVEAPRRVVGFELKGSYYQQAARNAERAREFGKRSALPLFQEVE